MHDANRDRNPGKGPSVAATEAVTRAAPARPAAPPWFGFALVTGRVAVLVWLLHAAGVRAWLAILVVLVTDVFAVSAWRGGARL